MLAKKHGHNKIVQVITDHVRAALTDGAAPAAIEEEEESGAEALARAERVEAEERAAVAAAEAASEAAAKELEAAEAEAAMTLKAAALKAEAELKAAVKSRQIQALKDAIAAHAAAGGLPSKLLIEARKLRDQLALELREKAAEEKKLRQKQEKEEKRLRMAAEEARKKALAAAAAARGEAKAAEEEAAAKAANEAETAKAARASARKEAEAAEKASRAAKAAARKETEAAEKAMEKAMKAAAEEAAEAEKALRVARLAARKEEQDKAREEEKKKKDAEAAAAAIEARAKETARMAAVEEAEKNLSLPLPSTPPMAPVEVPPLPSSAVTVAEVSTAPAPCKLDLPSQLCQWCTTPALPPANLMAATRSFSAARAIGSQGGLTVTYRADALVQPAVGTHSALLVLSRPLAVKQLAPRPLNDHEHGSAAAAVEWQLLKEACLLSRCFHPNVLPLIGHSAELLCLVYPLVSGGNVCRPNGFDPTLYPHSAAHTSPLSPLCPT